MENQATAPGGKLIKIDGITPDQIRNAREQAGLTQSACAELFDYSLRGWQQKETAGKNGRALSLGEYNYLLLLADQHPEFILEKRK